jgi:hypothetical protein
MGSLVGMFTHVACCRSYLWGAWDVCTQSSMCCPPCVSMACLPHTHTCAVAYTTPGGMQGLTLTHSMYAHMAADGGGCGACGSAPVQRVLQCCGSLCQG